MRRMQAAAGKDARGCDAKEESAACIQRMNASAHAEAPQRQGDVGVGSFSLRTCMRSGSSSSDGEAPEVCAFRQLPSSSWCLDELLPCTFELKLQTSMKGWFSLQCQCGQSRSNNNRHKGKKQIINIYIYIINIFIYIDIHIDNCITKSISISEYEYHNNNIIFICMY